MGELLGNGKLKPLVEKAAWENESPHQSGRLLDSWAGHMVSDKEWWEATDKKFQAWPRTAGPPVVMNPISRQNFIVKSPESS
ncbi:hypothetical protein KSP40_PGU006767 [Platanthera guangdongensis]|uniref:Uncharacterized protein n=1 Tax=Platanthera guangdongensis TaxID=2320717 RepID=A0ABR2MY35_9ASPA